jgi:ferredoxin
MAKVTVKDPAGNVMAEFEANAEESLGTQAQEAGAPIPFSCGVGACRTCVCKVEKGLEYIDREAVGPMHIMVEDDENLTCVSGIKPGTASDAEIVVVAENL